MQTKTTTTWALALILAAAPLASAQEASGASAAPKAPPRSGPPDGRLPKLPAAITSFGAAVSDGTLFVYGGHIGKAHAHSRDNLADGFWKLDLARPQQWDALPMREKLQGLALVSWKGSLIRIGGVSARNAPSEKTDMHSTAEVERFDPKENAWKALTPLPEPRSSFDAVVVGDKLYVIGGWALAGGERSGTWAEKNYVADLSQDPIQWEPMPEAAFRQRALAVAATGKHIYAIGGLTPEGESTQGVQVFDLEKGAWTKGPEFPASGATKGFGASAWGIGDTIWASASDGKVFAISEGEQAWRDAEFTLASPRFFHRILPHPKGSLLFIGGAGKGGHTDSIENIDLTTLKAKSAANLPMPTGEPISPTKPSTGQTNWPGFRGLGDSHTTARDLPLTWSDTEHMAWSVALDGYGQSSPVVWDGKVFVTSVVGPNKETLLVQSFDLANGDRRWKQEFPSGVSQPVTDYISKGTPTPVVDAERVYAFFETGEFIAFDHDGKVQWRRSLTKDHGEFKGNHGIGTSPAQTKDSVVVVIDHDGPSYLLCLDKKTGETRWKTDREKRFSWSSPLIIERPEQTQIVINSSGSVEAYEAASGTRIWHASGFKMNNVPSPTLAGDLIVAGSADKDQTVAIRYDGKDDVSATHIAWHARDASVNFASPLVVGKTVYSVNKAGVAFANDLSTGALRWSLRLPDSCWASPVGSGDLLYFFGKGGTTTILRDTAEGPQRVAESKLTITGRVYGVAAVDGSLLLRTGDRLLCLRGN